VNNLKELLAEQDRLEKAQQRIVRDIAAAQEAGKSALRQQVVQLLKDNGTTVEELFGVGSGSSTKKRQTRIPKYWHDGRAYDGRTARAVDGFDNVRIDGKIDDKQALKAGMINPAGLETLRPDVRAFAKRFGL